MSLGLSEIEAVRNHHFSAFSLRTTSRWGPAKGWSASWPRVLHLRRAPVRHANFGREFGEACHFRPPGRRFDNYPPESRGKSHFISPGKRATGVYETGCKGTGV